MKMIPKEDFYEIINAMDGDAVSKEACEQVFDKFGDDYYRDSSWSALELCNECEARKELLKQIKRKQ